MRGKIVKAVGGFYYLQDGENVHACRARGLFRNMDLKPLVGDEAEFELTHTEDVEGFVTEILPRKNELVRPAVANVDLMLAFFAMKDPAPNMLHISRLLLAAETAGVRPVIVLNKSDLVNAKKVSAHAAMFRGTGYELHTVSVKTGEGIDEILPLLAGKTTVLAGPSGAGKSSFLNAVLGGAHMETGEISRKLQRGRHTTRHTELFYLGDEGYLLDTPGFSALDNDLEPEQIRDYFPEFSEYQKDCRFAVCVHADEPDCAVKKALAEGKISPERYEAYLALYRERKSAKRY